MIESKRLRWIGRVTLWMTGEVHIGLLVGKPEVSRLLGRPEHSW